MEPLSEPVWNRLLDFLQMPLSLREAYFNPAMTPSGGIGSTQIPERSPARASILRAPQQNSPKTVKIFGLSPMPTIAHSNRIVEGTARSLSS